MTRKAVLAFVTSVVLMLGLNAAIYGSLIQRSGVSDSLMRVSEILASPFGTAGSAADQQQFACSEIERGEAAVWPYVSSWLGGSSLWLPNREDVSIAVSVLDGLDRFDLSTDFQDWAQQRRGLLEPFIETGFEQNAEDIGLIFRELQALNEEFLNFCDGEASSESYKGLSVDKMGLFPGMIAWSDGNDYGGEGTPQCFVNLPPNVAEGVETLELTVSVLSDTSEREETFLVDLVSPAMTPKVEGDLVWFGVSNAEDDSQLVAIADFLPETMPSQGPASFSCEAVFTPGGDSYREKTLIHVWRG